MIGILNSYPWLFTLSESIILLALIFAFPVLAGTSEGSGCRDGLKVFNLLQSFLTLMKTFLCQAIVVNVCFTVVSPWQLTGHINVCKCFRQYWQFSCHRKECVIEDSKGCVTFASIFFSFFFALYNPSSAPFHLCTLLLSTYLLP